MFVQAIPYHDAGEVVGVLDALGLEVSEVDTSVRIDVHRNDGQTCMVYMMFEHQLRTMGMY